MWCDCRDSGCLELADSEAMLYETFQEHKCREGESALADAWLCAHRPVLLQSKLRAAEARRGVAVGVSDDVSVSSSEDELGEALDLMDPEEFELELESQISTSSARAF